MPSSKPIRWIFLAILWLLFAFPQTALANWREDIGVFRIGIVTGSDIAGNLARSEPFRLAVSEALEMDVEFFPASGSKVLIDALVAERIEYAILSASGYALASVRCECVEPLVIPRSSDSTDGYHLVALTRNGSVFDPKKLSGKAVAMVSREAIVGEAFAKYLLEKEFETNTGEITFRARESSEATQQAFIDGDFDVLIGWSSLTGDPGVGYTRGTLNQIAGKLPQGLQSYRIGWKSPSIPHRPHVLRKNLPGEAKTRLRDVLVNLFERDPVAYDSIEPVYGGGFTAARETRFRDLIDFLKSYDVKSPEDAEAAVGSIDSPD
ncbi:MAG: PhnD/SsuA/transferrin family substrate-binding protein [Rhizobiaceae bacterium]